MKDIIFFFHLETEKKLDETLQTDIIDYLDYEHYSQSEVRNSELKVEIEDAKKLNAEFYFLIDTYGEFIKYEKMQFLLINPITGKDREFYILDKDKQRMDIAQLKNKPCFFRTSVQSLTACRNFLRKNSIYSITSQNDTEIIDQWYKYIPKKWLKRKIIDCTFKDLTQNKVYNHLVKKGKVFIKSEIKGFHFLVYAQYLDFTSNDFINVEEESIWLVSEPMDLMSDNYGTVEYRVWVAHHVPSSISRYQSIKGKYKIPREIHEFIHRFCIEMKEILPLHYVVDIGILKDRNIVVIELNELEASGRYQYNYFDLFIKSLTEK